LRWWKSDPLRFVGSVHCSIPNRRFELVSATLAEIGTLQTLIFICWETGPGQNLFGRVASLKLSAPICELS